MTRKRARPPQNPFIKDSPDMDALWHQINGGEIDDDGFMIPQTESDGPTREQSAAELDREVRARSVANALVASCQQVARQARKSPAAALRKDHDRKAAARAAKRVINLAYFADAVLPELPALKVKGRRGELLARLLRRCTERSLLAADEEASDLHLDNWVTSNMWERRYPPSHPHHPWHRRYLKAREDELLDEPVHVDYAAERAAVQGRGA
jgi:hypothetical protein